MSAPPSAPGGGYAPYAPYPPSDNKAGGYASPYPPVGPQDGGMGYPPAPGQAPYPAGPPMGAYGAYPPNYSDATEPVAMQPTKSNPAHVMRATCPYGLDSLLDTGKIRFKQEIHVTQIICGCDMPIEFDLINESHQIIYQVQERENLVMRNCVPQGFRTTSVVSTMTNAPVLNMMREARCVFNCCLPCCCFPLPFSRERLSVYGENLTQLHGIVQQDCSAWTSRFSVLDATGDTVLKIEGPGCNFACCNDIEFKILSLDGRKIGGIVKHFTGVIRETLSDFDNFTITFPRDMDVRTKATLLGAVNLINFLFFQGAIRRLPVGCAIGCNMLQAPANV